MRTTDDTELLEQFTMRGFWRYGWDCPEHPHTHGTAVCLDRDVAWSKAVALWRKHRREAHGGAA